MYRVWNVYKVEKGRRKGGPAYPGAAEFATKCKWCEKNAPKRWQATMGFFAFDREADAEAFRAVFGESKPDDE